MIYLNSGFFKPLFVLVSFLTLPLIVAIWGLFLLEDKIEVLVVAIIFSLCYFLCVLGIYRHSKMQKYILVVQDNSSLSIKYPNIQKNNTLELSIDQIINIEYYKITSIKAWCMLYNCIAPQCAFLTYETNQERKSAFIGYPDIKQLQELCDTYNIRLVIK